MGTQTSAADNNMDFNINDWNQVYANGAMRVLVNRHNSNFQVEEYPFSIATSRDLNFFKQILSIRKNDPHLVNVIAYNLSLANTGYYQNRGQRGLMYMQRIPNRLNNIGLLNLPQYLHVLSQSINGFTKLSKFFGFFKVSSNCIGINNKRVAKVWHHPDFTSISPQQMAFSQHQMVLSIMDSIQPFVDINFMPKQQPSFRYFVLKTRQIIDLPTLYSKLMQYASYFNNRIIPNSLNFNQKFQVPAIHHQNHHFLSNSTVQRDNANYGIVNQSYQINRFQPKANFRQVPPNTIYNHPVNTHSQPLNNHPILPQQHIIPRATVAQNNNYQQQTQYLNGIHNTSIQTIPINNNPSFANLRPNNEAKVPLIFKNRPRNVEFNSLRSSQVNLLPQLQIRQMKNSVRSQRSASSQRPLSISSANFQIRPQKIHRAESERALSPSTFYHHRNLNTDRSFSAKNTPLNVVFLNSTLSPAPANNLINRNPQPIFQPHRQLKPMSIKQAIQKSEYKQVRFDEQSKVAQKNENNLTQVNTINQDNNNNHHNNITKQKIIVKPLNIAQIKKSQNLNTNELKKDPWEIIMKVVNSKPIQPTHLTEKRMLQTIPLRPLTNDQLNKQIPYAFSSRTVDGYQSQKDRNDQNSSFNSELNGAAHILRESHDKFFHDMKDAESINNSSARNFQSNFPGEDFSQVVQPSSPLDYQLRGKDKFDLSDVNQQTMGLSSSKIIEERSGFTPLDLMQKLKITQTIIKNDQNDKYEYGRQLTTSQRSKSRQLSQQVAKLGFRLNSEQSNNSADVSIQNNRKQNQRQDIKQWTPSYKQTAKNNGFNFYLEDKPKYDWEYNSKYTPNIDIQSIPETKPYEWKQNQYTFQNSFAKKDKYSYATYDKIQQSPERYKFEWDPDLLADMQSKAYLQQ